jgi:hypothetical protein
MKLTVEPATVQTPVVAEVNTTARPEEAEAVTAYVAPPTVAPTGALEEKLTVCAPLATENVCWAWVAAL